MIANLANCAAAIVMIAVYVLHRLNATNMVVPENAERYISPRSRAYVQAIIDLKTDNYHWPE